MTNEENRLRARIEDLERELDEAKELAAVNESAVKPLELQNEELARINFVYADACSILEAENSKLLAALQEIESYEYDHTVDGCENCVRLQDIATRVLGHER